MRDMDIPLPAGMLQVDGAMSEEQWVALLEVAETHAADAEMDVEDVLVGMADVDEHRYVDSTRRAAWSMARYVEAQAELDDMAAIADDWRAEIDAWEHAATKDARLLVSFLRPQLEAWARARRAESDKVKTFELPGGSLATTKRQATVKVEDQEALVAWAKQHRPDLVEKKVVTTERVPVADLKRVVKPGQHPVGAWVALACGHRARVDGLAAMGEVVYCFGCARDAQLDEDDAAVGMQPVAEVEQQDTVLAPVDAEHGLVPGTWIEPERIDVHLATN